MTVLGGFRSFTGPIVGAVVFNYLKTYAVASTEYWQLLLGVVLVVLVMVLPTGIVGTAARARRQDHAEDAMSLLQTVNLKKYFGETRAVDNVTLTIEEGEFISLVGPNGAGKTSLCNVVSAYLRQDSGQIIFKGADVSNASVTERVRAGIARSFQLVNLFDDLTAFDNVALAIFSRQRKTRNLAALAHLDRAVNEEADAVLGQFGLAGKRNELARGISAGRAQTARRGARLRAEAEASVPRRADQRGLAPATRARSWTRSPRWCAAKASPRSWSSTTWTSCSSIPTGSS